MEKLFILSVLVFADLATATPNDRRVLEDYACPADGQAKVALFDADSTLRVSRRGTVFPQTADDVSILPMISDKIRPLNNQGYLIAIMSNQGGVPRQISFLDAQAVAAATAHMIANLGVVVNYFDFSTKCYEDPAASNCEGWLGPESEDHRKPNIGMARMLEQKIAEQCPGATLDPASSFFVGDAGYQRGVDGPHLDGRPADDFSNSDRLFAETLGVAFYEPTDYFGWRQFEVYNFGNISEIATFVEFLQSEVTRLRGEGDYAAADYYQRIIDETGPF